MTLWYGEFTAFGRVVSGALRDIAAGDGGWIETDAIGKGRDEIACRVRVHAKLKSANCYGLAREKKVGRYSTTPPFQVAIGGLVGWGKSYTTCINVIISGELWRKERSRLKTEWWTRWERKEVGCGEKWTVDRVRYKRRKG